MASAQLEIELEEHDHDTNMQNNTTESQKAVNIEVVDELSDVESDFALKAHGGKIWSQTATRLMLEEYRKREEQFKNPNYTKKQLWVHVAKKLRESQPNWNVTGPECDKKFRNMKQTYKNILDNNMYNSKPISWPYYSVMDELLKNDESIHNPAINDFGCVKYEKPTAHKFSVQILNEESDDEDSQTSVTKKRKTESPSTTNAPEWWKQYSEQDRLFKSSIQKSINELRGIFKQNLLEQQRKNDLISKLLDIMK